MAASVYTLQFDRHRQMAKTLPVLTFNYSTDTVVTYMDSYHSERRAYERQAASR